MDLRIRIDPTLRLRTAPALVNAPTPAAMLAHYLKLRFPRWVIVLTSRL